MSSAVRSATVLPVKNLHILRAIAVLQVLLCHLAYLKTGARFVHVLGQMGVDQFFVLTALVLSQSIERLSAKTESVARWSKEFLIKRIFRLCPLLIAVVLVVKLGSFPYSTNLGSKLQPASTWTMAFASMTNFQNMIYRGHIVFVILWTLPIEFQMYLLLPMYYLFQRKGGKAFLGLIAVSLAVAAFEAHFRYERVLWRFEILAFLPCFMPGVIAHYLLRIRAWKPVMPSWTWLPSVVLWTAFASLWGDPFSFYVRWLYCLGIGIMIPCFKDFSIKPAKVLSSHAIRAVEAVSERSYSIYLGHVLAIMAVWRGCERATAWLFAIIAAVLLVRAYMAGKSGKAATMPSLLAVVLFFRTPSMEFTPSSLVLFASVLAVLVMSGYELVEVPGMKLGQMMASGGFRLGVTKLKISLSRRFKRNPGIVIPARL